MHSVASLSWALRASWNWRESVAHRSLFRSTVLNRAVSTIAYAHNHRPSAGERRCHRVTECWSRGQIDFPAYTEKNHIGQFTGLNDKPFSHVRLPSSGPMLKRPDTADGYPGPPERGRRSTFAEPAGCGRTGRRRKEGDASNILRLVQLEVKLRLFS